MNNPNYDNCANPLCRHWRLSHSSGAGCGALGCQCGRFVESRPL